MKTESPRWVDAKRASTRSGSSSRSRRVRWAALLAVGLASACNDEETTIVNTVGGSGPSFASPALISTLPEHSHGTFGADLGPDGEPRVAYVRLDSFGDGQLCFVRRRADGTWTDPLAFTTPFSETLDFLFVRVTPNGMTQVVWERSNGIHYARLTDAATPTIDASDTIISATIPSNVGPGASLMGAMLYDIADDPATGNVFVVWRASIDDNGGANGPWETVPVVAMLTAGAGSFGEHFALVDPDSDANNASVDFIHAAVSPSGVAHVVWTGNPPNAASTGPSARHSARTSPGAWSGGTAGTAVSDSGYANDVKLVLAADDDAYVVWFDLEVYADYRPAGGAFGTDRLVTADRVDVIDAVLEPGSERLHVAWSIEDSPAVVGARSCTAANLPDAWSSVETLHSVSDYSFPPFVMLWADATDRVVALYRAAATDGAPDHLMARTRPSGAASTFGPAVVFSAAGPAPVTSFGFGTDSGGNARVVWTQGEGALLPDMYAASYTSGGAFGAVENVSRSPNLPTLQGGGVLLKENGVAHLFFAEQVGDAGESLIFHTTSN